MTNIDELTREDANNRRIAANLHLKMSLNVIRYIGTWPPVDNCRNLYLFYSACSLTFVLGIYVFVQSVNLIMVWGDVPKMVAGAFLLMTNASHAYKVVNIFWKQKRIKKLLDVVDSRIFFRENTRFESIANEYAWKGVFHYAAYQTFGTITVFCWALGPLSTAVSKSERRLPMDGWYPYDTTTSPAFEFTYAHQAVAVMIGCFHNIAMDTLVTGLMTVACCQFEFFKQNLIDLRPTSRTNEVQSIRLTELEVEQRLGRCVEHHRTIVDFIRETNDIFGITVMIQLLVNCIIICLNAFRMAQMRNVLSAEFIGTTTYTCCMTYQIFIFCWHGNEIKIHSQSVPSSAFTAKWWLCEPRVKRSICQIILYANQPLTLKAGNLLTLSLDTFGAILRASYSFFTVLQHTTDKTSS